MYKNKQVRPRLHKSNQKPARHPLSLGIDIILEVNQKQHKKNNKKYKLLNNWKSKKYNGKNKWKK